MKKILLLLFAILLLGFKMAYAFVDYPAPESEYISDLAKKIDGADYGILAEELNQLNMDTGIKIHLLTLRRIGDYDNTTPSLKRYIDRLHSVWAAQGLVDDDDVIFATDIQNESFYIKWGPVYSFAYKWRMRRVIRKRVRPLFLKGKISSSLVIGTKAIKVELGRPMSFLEMHVWLTLACLIPAFIVLCIVTYIIQGQESMGWKVWVCVSSLAVAAWLAFVLQFEEEHCEHQDPNFFDDA